jgi:hypothetical protein
LECHYKEQLSGYSTWEELSHAQEWLLFPQNMGSRLSIDAPSLSDGELYTIVPNKAAKGRKGAIVAIVGGTASEQIIEVLERLGEEQLNRVEEVRLDMADSMRKIVRRCFPERRYYHGSLSDSFCRWGNAPTVVGKLPIFFLE